MASICLGLNVSNTLKPDQNDRYFTYVLKYILLREEFCMLIWISLDVVPKEWKDPALV